MLFKYETHVIQIKYYIITILILEVQFYKHITKVDKVYNWTKWGPCQLQALTWKYKV